jgi:hypothetical protein
MAADAEQGRRHHQPLHHLDRRRPRRPARDLHAVGRPTAPLRRRRLPGLRPRHRPALAEPGRRDRTFVLRDRPRGDDARPYDAREVDASAVGRRTARVRRRDQRRPRRRLHVDTRRRARRARRRPAGARPDLVQPEHGLHPAPADLRRRHPRRDRVLLGLVMELSTWDAFAGGIRAVYKPAVAFALLILVLLVRPQGVLGKARTV